LPRPAADPAHGANGQAQAGTKERGQARTKGLLKEKESYQMT
jgi:hypothetical protein